MSTTSFRLAARLARREVRQRPWRTVLVGVLVAVPVALMTIVAVLFRTDTPTALEEWTAANGAADAVLGGRTRATVDLADLPAGSRVLSYQVDFRLLRSADGTRRLGEITNLAVADPLAAGIARIEGRAPQTAGEVLVSTEIARKFGLVIGGAFDLDRPLDATLTVVGIGRWDSTNLRMVVLHPSAPFPARPGDQLPTRHLVAFPDSFSPADAVAWANQHSVVQALSPALRARAGANIGPEDDAVEVIRWVWVAGAVLLTVMGIVIAAAFAVGARRQLTTLGQLAANGAAPRILRRVLVLQGSWTWLVGAAAGLGLGMIALAVMAPHRDRILGRLLDSWDIRFADIGPIVVLGIVAATIAAVVPARSASRIPVMAALAGRKPLTAVPAWLTVTGLAMCGAGLGLLALAMFGVRGGGRGSGDVWGFTAVLGGVSLLLGACAVAPGYVSVLGPAAAGLGGTWRLAARSLARQRSRTGAVVSAVCATTAILLAWSAVIQSSEAHANEGRMPDDRVLVHARTILPGPGPGPDRALGPAALSPPDATLLAGIRRALPSATLQQLRWAPVGTGSLASIADEALLDALDFNASERRQLAATGVALVGSEAPSDAFVTFSAADGRAPVAVRAAVIEVRQNWWSRLPTVLVTPERAAELGLVPQDGDVIVQQPTPLTDDQRDAVEAAYEEGLDALPRVMAVGGGTTVRITEVEYARPPSGPDPLVLDAIFAGIAFLFVLLVVASSLALAAAETRSERDVLTVMGAPPRVIRRTSGAKAIVLTVFGVVLALPVALLPVAMFTRIMEGGMPFVLPWRAVLLVVVGVPLMAGLMTTGASALSLRFRPVRTSTMSFE